MDVKRPLSRDDIAQVWQLINLDDLTSSPDKHNRVNDIQNDIDYLLNWLSPYFPGNSYHFAEPSPRVKSAIKSCSKESNGMVDIVTSYSNSIRVLFLESMPKLIFREGIEWFDIVSAIKNIKQYYALKISYLNLNEDVASLFDHNVNSLFREVLVDSEKSDFDSSLSIFFHDFAFNLKVDKSIVHDSVSTLLSIGLKDKIHFIMIQSVIDKIKDYVRKISIRGWHELLLENINCWIESEIYPRFEFVSEICDENSSSIYLYELMKIAHDELVSLRINEIFELAMAYPKSYNALHELHQCLSFKFNVRESEENMLHASFVVHASNNSFMAGNNSLASNFTKFSAGLVTDSATSQAYQRAKLVDMFTRICNKCLLNSGVNTIDIIKGYSSTIKSFLIIDPKGVLLDKVARPLRRYLKTREDIIIKLVHGLLDYTESNELIELAKELRVDERSNIFEEINYLNWAPDPIDALPDFKKGKIKDVIESLISIFDSKAIFIEEFTKLFAERLIKTQNYDVKPVTDHLNLLKQRFGEEKFTAIDIMVKDILDSKKINSLVQFQTSVCFSTIILSHLYWPNLSKDNADNNNIKLPPQVSEAFNDFKKQYSTVRKGRNINLLTNIGTVKIEIFRNNIVELFQTTPINALIINLFDNSSKIYSSDEVGSYLNVSTYEARNGLEYWTKNNVLTSVSVNNYKANEDIN